MLEAASSALAVGHARLPNEHAFLGERAKLAEDLCEWQVAAQFWEDLTRRQPTNGEAWAAVARVVRRMGDPHDAERWINEAISLLPQNRAVLAEAVTIAKARGDHNAQLARMELFCCAFPADIDARIALIETYGAGGVYQKAFAEVESMLVSQIKSYRLLSIATSLTRSKNDLTPLLRLWDRLVISGRYDARNLSNDCVSLLLAFSGDQNCSKLIGPIMELPIDLDAADMPPFLHVAIALRSHPYGSVSWGIFCDAFKERKIVIADPLVRHLLSALIETSQDISIIRSTVAELLNLAKPGNWLKDALIVIYSPYYQTPALTAVLKDIFATICTDRRALAQSSDVALYILLLLADALSENNFDRLILAIKNSGRLSAVAPGERDVTSVLARIVEKSMPRSVALPPASISNLRRRLRICICVSGQLRGYLAAFPSWQRLGLWDHDLTLVVHTWKNIGRNIPDNPINAARSFTGEFLSAYKSVILAKGWVFMQAAYPNLVGEILSGQSIEPATLYDFYSAASVQVDDEFAEPFKGMNNFWKMHYKIAQAHQAAVAACPDADLVIRLRPDKAFTKAEPIDWQQLLVESHGHRIIFADKPRHLAPPLWIGDQFAAGTREVMESYSRTFELTEKAGRSACYGFPVEHFGHTNLSCTTFQDGIGVRRFAKIGPESLLSAAHVEPAKIVAALQQDFALRSSQPDDVALLEGATLDQAIAEAVS